MKATSCATALIAIALASGALAQQTGAPALADEPATAPQAPSDAEAAQEAAEEPDPGEEVICRRERVTGSLTRVNKICLTRNEWNEVHDKTRDSVGRFQRNAAGGVMCRQDQMGGC